MGAIDSKGDISPLSSSSGKPSSSAGQVIPAGISRFINYSPAEQPSPALSPVERRQGIGDKNPRGNKFSRK
jgi:hypothetical protein